MATGVEVAAGVEVDVGIGVGPNNCPGAQLDKARLKSKTNIIAVLCLVFIISPLRDDGRTRWLLKVSRITFLLLRAAQRFAFAREALPKGETSRVGGRR